MSEDFSDTVQNLLQTYRQKREEEEARRRKKVAEARRRRERDRAAVRKLVRPVVSHAASLLREAGHDALVREGDLDSLAFLVKPQGGTRRQDGPVPYTMRFQPDRGRLRATATFGERSGTEPLGEWAVDVEELDREWVEKRVAEFLERVFVS